MARTSLKALEIPDGVTLENNQGVITFTGKLGNLSLEIHEDVDINKDEGICNIDSEYLEANPTSISSI